jgi:hypothetical protein
VRKSKYGVSPKDVCTSLSSSGYECSERSVQNALKWFASGGLRFSSARAAAIKIVEYHRLHGRFPRGIERCRPAFVQPEAPVLRDALEREVGCAILLLRRLGIKVEVQV